MDDETGRALNKLELDIAIRLGAVEHVLIEVNTVSLLLALGGNRQSALAVVVGLRTTAADRLREQTFPAGGPAMSDHVAAELQSRVEWLLSDLERRVRGAPAP